MKVYVRLNHNGKTVPLAGFSASSTVNALKKQIQLSENLPENLDNQIVFAGRVLSETSTFSDNDIIESSTLHLVSRTMQSDSALRCGVCFERYGSEGARVPHVLPCGHSLCGLCISQLHPRVCPFDRLALPPNDFPRWVLLVHPEVNPVNTFGRYS
jgi:hypothetical protein